MLRLKVTGLLICLYVLGTYGADKYTDENRPYEFGFTIEGEQHRHEKKDENGIVMGEFGFITADGVYHVTVYATDEQGRFKILSMKNIRVKPYPTAGIKKGHSLPFPPSGNSPISQGPTTTKPQPEINPELNKPVGSPAKSCSHCSLPTTTTKAPQLTNIAVVSKDRPSSISTSPIRPSNPQLFNSGVLRQQAPASSLGPQNNVTASIFAQNSPQYQQTNTQQQIFGGQQSNVQQKNVIDQNYEQPGLTTNQNQQANDINRYYPHPEIDQYQPALTGNQNLQRSGNNRNYPQQTIEQNYQQPGLEGNQNLQTSNINKNYPQSAISQNQPSFISNQQAYQQENNANRNFLNGIQNYTNQNYPQGQTNENQNYPQTGQPQKSNDIYNNRAAQEQSSQPQYRPDSPNVPTNSASYSGTENLQTPLGTLRNPKQYNDVPSFNNRFGQPQGFRDIIASQADQAIANKPTLVAAQMQIVSKDTDIHYRGPGEKEGLPSGISVDHVTQLLYTFNYTVGFHGHHEEGYTNGTKQGYYYVTGRNGIRTRIDYVADEKGFRPRISQEVLDLSSDDVPKPETEKDEEFGLKGYVFKWLYFPADKTLKQ